MKISIVIPVYNGARTVGRLVEELIKKLRYSDIEIVLVNDGSPDNSDAVCRDVLVRYKGKITYVVLARNFGEHNAVLAGLNHVHGDFTVIIDDDFQNPPEEIERLVQKAVEGGHDVVYSYYERKRHSFLRNLGSKFNDLFASYLLDKPKGLYLSSFKCLNRFIVREIVKYKGPYPYIDGLILRLTQRIGRVLVRHDHRKDGSSGYTFRKLVRLWMNMFVNFSIYPLRVSMMLGFVFSCLGGIAILFMIVDKIIHPDIVHGFTSIMVAILMFSGIQLIMLGLIGEYIGKLFMSNNQTPQFVEREVIAAQARES